MSALPVERKSTHEIIDQIMADSSHPTSPQNLISLHTQIHSLIESLDTSSQRMKFLKSRLHLLLPTNAPPSSQKAISLMSQRIRAAVNDSLMTSSSEPTIGGNSDWSWTLLLNKNCLKVLMSFRYSEAEFEGASARNS